MRQYLLVFLLGVYPAGAYAQTRQPQEFRVSATTSPIAVDGALDEPIWQQATPIPLAFEFFPGDNTPAVVDTSCFVTFDTDALYVGCRASEPEMSALRANLADRDEPLQDDTVGFMIDTFNDGRRAFQFRVNPRGVQMDAFNNDVDGTEDWSWDAIWDANAQIGADGYSVEIAVPFSSLRFPRASGVQTWGFMAMRDRPRSTRYRMRSSFVDQQRACLVCQFDKVTGFAVTPGLNLELDPTVTAARSDARESVPAGPLVSGDVDTQAGLSARWSVTPNVVVSGTVNPDFYQVEADAAQLNVNDRFELFFPEKRPFFLEGSDFFGTPIDAVFTRTIADPNAGVKLTGKEGAHAFGVFAAHDSVTGVLIPGFDSSSFFGLDQSNFSTVLRYRRDLGASGSTLGVLYTGRESSGYGNRVAGIDGLARMSPADSVSFQWLGSQTEYPGSVAAEAGQPADGLTGQGVAATYTHSTRYWYWQGRTTAHSPTFRADSGFLPQVDTWLYAGTLRRTFIGSADRWFNEIWTSGGCDRTTDWHSERASWGCDWRINYSGPLQMTANYNLAPNSEYYRGETYFNLRNNVQWSIRPSGAFSLDVSATEGGAVDFANGRKADQIRFGVTTTYNLFGRLNGEISHTLQSLDVADGHLFTARLTQGQVLYHLNLRTFIRAILQYTDITRDPALYFAPTSAVTHRLFSQYLFSYKLNPQTVLLVGYSDNASGTQTVDLVRSDRTFFLKVGYAWVQ
jgi:hypothetical protein